MVIKKGISQTEAAKEAGVTRQAVNKALSTENPQCGKEVDVPDHIAANKNSKTDFLKLSVAGQQAVRGGQPLNRVALAASLPKLGL
jgi:predicted transcriptional regulator